MTDEMTDRILAAVDQLREEMIEFAAATVTVSSVTGDEDAVQEVYARHLGGMGLELDVWRPQPADAAGFETSLAGEPRFGERPNVVGTWRGSGGGRSLALNGHVDVVPAGKEERWRYPPFGGARAEGRLWGRGACDMKGPLAAGIFAVAALQRADVRLAGDVQVQCVVAEETSGLGTITTIRRGHVPDGVLCLEPTELAVAPAMGGLLKFRLTVFGRAAHTSLPWNGVSAFERFLPIYEGLKALEAERHAEIRHPLFDHLPRKAPFAAGLVVAGEWPYAIPERLVAQGRIGMVPGDDPEAIRRRFIERVQAVAAADPWLREHPPVIEWVHGQFDPWQTPGDHPLVDAVREAATVAAGAPPRVEGVTYGADAAFFVHLAGVPAVIYGPGSIGHAHFTDEFVAEADLVTAAKTIALAAVRWCGQG